MLRLISVMKWNIRRRSQKGGGQVRGGISRRPILTALLLAPLLTAGCGKRAGPPLPQNLPTLPVRVQAVELKLHITTEEVVGTVRSRLRTTLEAKISGRIDKMLANQGQVVKAGQVLAELDVREIKAKLDQTLATREQTERDLERFAKLLQEKVVTQSEYDAMQARQRVAAATATEAETVLSYARITAPFDGVVTRKTAEVGDLATPGKPLLEMEDPTALRLEADIPETLIGRVQAGAKLPVRIPVTGADIEGTVSEIAPAADSNSRTFLVKIELPPGSGLRPGLFGRVVVPTGESTALRVPASAVLQRGQMEVAFVVVSRSAQLRLIKTGKHLGDQIEVISGLSAGEAVAVEGASLLVDGQPVEIKP